MLAWFDNHGYRLVFSFPLGYDISDFYLPRAESALDCGIPSAESSFWPGAGRVWKIYKRIAEEPRAADNRRLLGSIERNDFNWVRKGGRQEELRWTIVHYEL